MKSREGQILRGFIKGFFGLVLLFTALVKAGLSWEGWIIVTIAAWSGMLWQAAFYDVFRPHPIQRKQ